MDRLLDLSKNSLQYGNSMCPSMIRKLNVIVYFRKVFRLSKFKYFCFVTILDMSLISRSCKNDHIIFNVGTPSLEARNIRFESLTDTLNFRTIGYFLTNLINDPSSLKLQSRDQNLI
jgi:hypothetical protein